MCNDIILTEQETKQFSELLKNFPETNEEIKKILREIKLNLPE